jgi:hypothetical protein
MADTTIKWPDVAGLPALIVAARREWEAASGQGGNRAQRREVAKRQGRRA